MLLRWSLKGIVEVINRQFVSMVLANQYKIQKH